MITTADRRVRAALLSELGREPLRGAADRVACVVGCGKSKATKPAPARALYTSPLFRKSLELAELLGDATFVASARHGIVELDDVVSPYDFTLVGTTKATRETWGRLVVDELEARALGGAACVRVVLFMGATYADPIVEELERRRRAGSPRFAPPVILMRGLEVGERLAFLNRAIATARGAR